MLSLVRTSVRVPLRSITLRAFSQSTSSNGAANGNGNGNANNTTTAENASTASTSNGTEVEALKKQLEQVKAELKETHDKYLFELAEAQNVRTRARREVENATKFGVTKFAQSLLDVADNLSRAIGAVPAEERKGGLYTGIVMTEKELAKAFEANGITKVPSMGVAFNPDVHQAMLETPADEAKGLTPGKVSLVLREGYSLHGRVIRPAQVGVVKSD